MEGKLPDEQKSEVSDQLRTNGEVRRELDGLRQILNTLNKERTVFCPDVSEIAEFVATGDDPSGRILAHLQKCVPCQTEVHALEDFRPASKIPSGIWNKIKAKLAEQRMRLSEPLSKSERSGSSSGSPSRLIPPFERPLYSEGQVTRFASRTPPNHIESMIALSTVTWKNDLMANISALPLHKERVAFLIALKNFKKQLDQEQIDFLYWALRPNEDEQKQYDIVTPSQVKYILAGLPRSELSVETAITMLRDKWRAEKVLVIMLLEGKDQFRVRCQATDRATGKLTGKVFEILATDQTLAQSLRNAAYSALKPKEDRLPPR